MLECSVTRDTEGSVHGNLDYESNDSNFDDNDNESPLKYSEHSDSNRNGYCSNDESNKLP